MKKSLPILLLAGVMCFTLLMSSGNCEDNRSSIESSLMIGFKDYGISKESKCENYLCRLPQAVYYAQKYDEIIKAIGHRFDEKLECFAHFSPEYLAGKFSQKPGDTVMILHGNDRYKALIGNMGLYVDVCSGEIAACSLATIDSMPKISEWDDFFLVLQKSAFFDGPIHQYGACNISDNSATRIIDSLKASFVTKAPVYEHEPNCLDSMIVFAELNRKDPKVIFVIFNCGFDRERDFSAYYILIFQNEIWNVYTQQPEETGSHGWEILNSFDLDYDGNMEYLIKTFDWELETIGVYSIIDGRLKCLYLNYFGGC